MTIQHFTWDARKAAANLKKHGISFETASRVFIDPNAITMLDRIENGEERWQTIGRIDGQMMVLVAHTLWEENENGQDIETIRIISARKAERHERRTYEEQ